MLLCSILQTLVSVETLTVETLTSHASTAAVWYWGPKWHERSHGKYCVKSSEILTRPLEQSSELQ